MLLIFRAHSLAAYGGSGNNTADNSARRVTEIVFAIRRYPASGLDAEDAEVDGIAFRRHDAVFGDDAVLLAASNYLACEE